MTKNDKNIAKAFYAFHDGSISFHKKENQNQIWKIDCEYLAEIINPSFKHFWIEIINCKFLEFVPWMNPVDLPKKY